MHTSQKITPHLWFDKEAKAAAKFYTSVFAGSKIISSVKLSGTPSGTVDIVTIDLAGQAFTLLSAGPLFKFTPAISFMVSCATKKEVDMLWEQLSVGGTALMELGSYPFSERYGWVEDKFGLSWQIMFTGNKKFTQKITPALLFVGDVSGRAAEAIEFYTATFDNSKKGDVMYYEEGEGPDEVGAVKHADFTLLGQEFTAMDSALPQHNFTFTEAISFVVHCENQEEIDYYWGELSAVPEAEQCGWIKDQFGVSWQIVPTEMETMMQSGDKKKIARVTEEFLKMKKFNIAKLHAAYEGT